MYEPWFVVCSVPVFFFGFLLLSLFAVFVLDFVCYLQFSVVFSFSLIICMREGSVIILSSCFVGPASFVLLSSSYPRSFFGNVLSLVRAVVSEGPYVCGVLCNVLWIRLVGFVL